MIIAGILNSYRQAAARIAARRRRRKTVLALAGLPEDIRKDIGWPDIYERQKRQAKECA